MDRRTFVKLTSASLVVAGVGTLGFPGEPYGVWVRGADRLQAAQEAREVATRLDRTLYLGRDVRNGDWLAFSGDAQRVPYRDRHYGEHPIVPRGHYWEARLIEEGRAVWIAEQEAVIPTEPFDDQPEYEPRGRALLAVWVDDAGFSGG